MFIDCQIRLIDVQQCILLKIDLFHQIVSLSSIKTPMITPNSLSLQKPLQTQFHSQTLLQ